MTYSEQLKDPRWQRKRLEILQRDNFTCTDCERADKTLHVHHCYYERDMDPWDYPDHCYKTLCDECHERRHELEMMVRKSLSSFNNSQLQELVSEVLLRCCIDGLDVVVAKCQEIDKEATL